MRTCFDTGTLRAYLDDELPAADEADAVATHLRDCAECQTQVAELQALDRQVRGHFAAVEMPAGGDEAAEVALAGVRSRLEGAPRDGAAAARKARGFPARVPGRRPLVASGAIAAALLLALLVPSVRAAANQLLQVFRVQSVVYVSVSPNRAQQLEHLQIDRNALFLSKPTEVGTPVAPQQVSSPQAAQPLVGFTPEVPTAFPGGNRPNSTTFTVQGQSTYQMQVNVATLRQILTTLGVTDVQIPDALGAQPITAVLPPNVQAEYQGQGYELRLLEGTSPTVTLPPGVDLAQLGKAALEVYGMSPQQADALSKQIDWGSTLVFPFPLGTNRIQQVNVQGAQGVLLDTRENGTWMGLVYWQQGSHFYILAGQGDAIGNTSLLEVANSLG